MGDMSGNLYKKFLNELYVPLQGHLRIVGDRVSMLHDHGKVRVHPEQALLILSYIKCDMVFPVMLEFWVLPQWNVLGADYGIIIIPEMPFEDVSKKSKEGE
jgi:hypothetical protein